MIRLLAILILVGLLVAWPAYILLHAVKDIGGVMGA